MVTRRSPLTARFPENLVPTVGFELTTYRLQGGCSTPELCGHIGPFRDYARMVLLRGIEPPTY